MSKETGTNICREAKGTDTNISTEAKEQAKKYEGELKGQTQISLPGLKNRHKYM